MGDANAHDFSPTDIKDALFGNDLIAKYRNDNIVKLFLKYKYPCTPATDDIKKDHLDGSMKFHSRVTQYEKLFFIFKEDFPKSSLQLAKMLENVNDSFRPRGCSDINQPTLFQAAVQFQNPTVVSYMIKNRKPNLDKEFLWIIYRLVRYSQHSFSSEKILVNILWFSLHHQHH